MQVHANDADGSSANNQIHYRIQSGAKDKFVIDSISGMISVSPGASLDPDMTVPKTFSYLLEIAAVDNGIGSDQLTGIALVNVTIIDVNNKPPVFESFRPFTLAENSNSGFFVTKIKATDPEISAKLR